MRWFVALLLLGLVAVVVVTFASPESTLVGAGTDWFPARVGRGAATVDRLYREIEVIALVLLAGTTAVLAWCVVRGAGRRDSEGSEREGSGALEFVWTLLPAAVIVFLTWSQVTARAEIDGFVADSGAEPAALVVEVEAAQFDWRFRYAGADGRFGTFDDVTEAVDLTVPIDRNVELRMRSLDVLHSFFVPALRLKRDVVPGTMIPLRFRIDREAYTAAGAPPFLELSCAELCGAAHYAMVGRVVPLEPDAFETWQNERSAWRLSGDASDPVEDEE